VNEADPYASLKGQVVRCYARDEFADDGARLVAHTKDYVKVLVSDTTLVGAHFDARVVKTHRWHVDGEVVQKSVLVPDPARPALRAALQRRASSVETSSTRKKLRRSGALPARVVSSSVASSSLAAKKTKKKQGSSFVLFHLKKQRLLLVAGWLLALLVVSSSFFPRLAIVS